VNARHCRYNLQTGWLCVSDATHVSAVIRTQGPFVAGRGVNVISAPGCPDPVWISNVWPCAASADYVRQRAELIVGSQLSGRPLDIRSNPERRRLGRSCLAVLVPVQGWVSRAGRVLAGHQKGLCLGIVCPSSGKGIPLQRACHVAGCERQIPPRFTSLTPARASHAAASHALQRHFPIAAATVNQSRPRSKSTFSIWASACRDVRQLESSGHAVQRSVGGHQLHGRRPIGTYLVSVDLLRHTLPSRGMKLPKRHMHRLGMRGGWILLMPEPDLAKAAPDQRPALDGLSSRVAAALADKAAWIGAI